MSDTSVIDHRAGSSCYTNGCHESFQIDSVFAADKGKPDRITITAAASGPLINTSKKNFKENFLLGKKQCFNKTSPEQTNDNAGKTIAFTFRLIMACLKYALYT